MKRIFLFLTAALAMAGCSKGHHADDDDAPQSDASVPSIVNVQTGTLKLATLHRYVGGYGTVETAPATADLPAAGAQLAAPSAGVVAKVNVLEGQHVERGDVLVELNSGSMTAESAAQELARQEQLYAQQNTSQKNLQNAQAQLAMLRVTATVSGTVARVNVKPGQAVDSTTVVAEVMDLNRLAVMAEIPAAEANDLSSGEPVEVLTDSPVTTELTFVSPNVSKDNDTVLVRALLPASGTLKPGQFIPLRIATMTHTNVLAAPIESVVTDDDGKSSVALVKGDQATQVTVQTGLRENGWAEVTAPELKVGDTVVTVGAYGLPDKTKITVQNPSGDETSTNSSAAK